MPVPSWRQKPTPIDDKESAPANWLGEPLSPAKDPDPVVPAEPINNLTYTHGERGFSTRLRSGVELTHAKNCALYLAPVDDWRMVCDCFVSRAKVTAFEDGTLTAVPYEFVHSLYAQIITGHKTIRDAKSLWQNQLAENEKLRVRAALATGLGALGWAYGIARGLGWF